MKRINKQNGITLIALVITIIVMLILVSVTISMAINGNLFSYAGKGAKETEQAKQEEQEISEGKIKVDNAVYNSIDDYLDFEEKVLVELPEGLKVGDYVNYTPTTGEYEVTSAVSGYTTNEKQKFTTETGDNALKWRVWSINEETGIIELISAVQTTNKLYLKGADGYNHAVDILNDMCEALYSNTNGAIARSINEEDIKTKTTYDYTAEKNYGKVHTLTNQQYPNIYAVELGSTVNGLNETENLLKASEGVRNTDGSADYSTYTGSSTASKLYVTVTSAGYDPESYLKSDQGVNTVPAGLINTGVTYWLATRRVSDYNGTAYFYEKVVYKDGRLLAGACFFRSDGDIYGDGFAVRPIVALGSDAALTLDEKNTIGDVNCWNVEFSQRKK